MGYKTTKIGDGTWMIQETEANISTYMYLLTGETQAVLIDTGMGLIPLDKIIAELTPLPVKVLLTHGHIDHMGGTACFPEVYLHKADAETYRCHATVYRQILADYKLPEANSDVQFMKDGDCFELGGRSIHVIHTPGHSMGSVCFLDTKNKWLFTGDTCCKANVLLNLEYSTSVEVYAETMARLLEKRQEYNTTWPGHHEWPVGISVLEHFREASKQLLDGQMEGQRSDEFDEDTRLLFYEDIGIVYKK